MFTNKDMAVVRGATVGAPGRERPTPWGGARLCRETSEGTDVLPDLLCSLPIACRFPLLK